MSQELQELRERVAFLTAQVAKHAADKGQDRCWENDCELAVACGVDPPVKPSDDPILWLGNCLRYAASVLGFKAEDYIVITRREYEHLKMGGALREYED